MAIGSRLTGRRQSLALSASTKEDPTRAKS